MGAVWRRPSLTGLEIAWRWLYGGLLLALIWRVVGTGWVRSTDEYRATLTMVLHGGFVFGVNWPHLIRTFMLLASAALLWASLWAAARTVLLRKLDPRLRTRWSTLAGLGVLRLVTLTILFALLCGGVFQIVKVAVLRPAATQAEPEYVLGFAYVLGLSLTLFVVWSLLSWVLQLAPVLAMARNLSTVQSVRAAMREGPLRLKLIEINLVMGVVKLALIVLAMVLSASPLAFQTVATQDFFVLWWMAAVLLYFAASDYFHVVRAAAYLSLWKTYHPDTGKLDAL